MTEEEFSPLRSASLKGGFYVNEKSERFIWLDIVKITACFFVIINHSHSNIFSFGGYNGHTVLFDGICFAICKTAVPLFVMTSGALLLERNSSAKKTFLRIFRVLVPLLLVSGIYYIRFYLPDISVTGFIKEFIKGPITVHLWYIYMLIGLYAVLPFVSKAVKSFSLANFAAFTFLFLILPPLINTLASGLSLTYSNYLMTAFFPMVIGYLVCGLFLTKVPLKRKFFCAAVFVFSASVGAFVLSICLNYIKSGQMIYKYDSWYSLPVVFSSLSLYYILRFLFEKIRLSDKITNVISEISSTTFGIYLLHCLLLEQLPKLAEAIGIFNPYFAVALIWISCFTLCSAAVFLLRKIPFISFFL